MKIFKLAQVAAVAAALLACSLADAQSKPFRADGGVQTATQSGWTGPNGVPGLYYKLSSGWWIRNPDNSEAGPLGAGGGSTGNWTFSGNNADLSGAGTLGIGLGTATGITLGGTGTAAGTVQTSSGRFRISQAVETGAALSAFSIAAAAHTALTASTEYTDVNFALNRTVQFSTGAIATDRWFRLQPPTISFVGASTVTNTALLWCDGAPKAGTNATLTNTACVWLQTGADAAQGIVVQANSSTQTGSLFTTVDSSGNKLITVVPSSSGQTHTLGLTTLVNGGGSVMTWANSTLGTTTTFALGSGNQVLMGGDSWIFQDHLGNTTELAINLNGIQSNRISNNNSTLKSFSATPAFDCTASNMIHIGTITGNVTGPTMVSGRVGEICTIVWAKDATAGAYTISGWGSNVRANGTATFTTTANSLITQTFRWDDQLTTPAWVLMSQQPGL